jgi:precorrin-6B methylase 2
MNRQIKKVAEILLPKRVFVTIQSIRSRNYQKRLHREWGVYESTVGMATQFGRTLLGGPFRGMKYPMTSLINRHSIPVLFGTYELELHPVIEEVALKHYDRIIDVGCAEGYYAVGLALRTDAEVYAFDCEPRERFYCRQMARENNVAVRVHVKSWCSTETLKRLAVGRCLIISDCEGYEASLFSGSVMPALKNSDLIIELHEIAGINIREVLLERFKSSHNARLITFDAARTGSEVPDKWRKFAREFRSPNQQWVYFTPHT